MYTIITKRPIRPFLGYSFIRNALGTRFSSSDVLPVLMSISLDKPKRVIYWVPSLYLLAALLLLDASYIVVPMAYTVISFITVIFLALVTFIVGSYVFFQYSTFNRLPKIALRSHSAASCHFDDTTAEYQLFHQGMLYLSVRMNCFGHIVVNSDVLYPEQLDLIRHQAERMIPQFEFWDGAMHKE